MWNPPPIRRLLFGFLVVSVAVAACGNEESTDGDPPMTARPAVPAGGTSAVPWHGLDGNRLSAGAGPLGLDAPVDVRISGEPIEWLVGTVVDGGPLWIAVDEAGDATVLRIDGDGSASSESAGTFGETAPPTVLARPDGVGLLGPGPGDTPFAPVVAVDGIEIHIDAEGSLHIGDSAVLEVRALPDARPVFDGTGRALMLTGPTDRYPHGVLGDAIEASSVSLIDLATGTTEVIIRVGPDEVIEGTAPIWADVDGDGRRDIVITISTPSGGARIAAFSESGNLIAESDPIGRSSRWRHQTAVAPLGPNGETELVDVLTPHIGGVIEFFRPIDGKLEIVASVGGYTSHFIGSRNLSVPVVADADGDGMLEVVLATQDRSTIVGVARSADGAEPSWMAALDGRLSSNLSAVTLPDGRLALAAGRSDGTVRVWMP